MNRNSKKKEKKNKKKHRRCKYLLKNLFFYFVLRGIIVSLSIYGMIIINVLHLGKSLNVEFVFLRNKQIVIVYFILFFA